jgi:hypothetical protein
MTSSGKSRPTDETRGLALDRSQKTARRNRDEMLSATDLRPRPSSAPSRTLRTMRPLRWPLRPTTMLAPRSKESSPFDWQSLLWRLRRATAIESGLFRIQAEHLLQFRHRRRTKTSQKSIDSFYRFAAISGNDGQKNDDSSAESENWTLLSSEPVVQADDLTRSFVRLSNLPTPILWIDLVGMRRRFGVKHVKSCSRFAILTRVSREKTNVRSIL